MKKIILVTLLLLGCSDEQIIINDMKPFIIASYSEGSPTPSIPDVYRFALIGDSIAVGRTDETDGQPSDLISGGVLSTVLTDNCENWNGNALRTHQLNMSLIDNFGGWGIEHRLSYEIINNNKALKVESLKIAEGSTGIAIGSKKWDIGGADLTMFETELTQWGVTLDNVFISLPINDFTSDALLVDLAILFEPFLQRLVDNTNINKISIFETVTASSITAGRLATGRAIVTDAIASIGSSKVVLISNNPLYTFIDGVHPDVSSTDLMAMAAYNNR